MPFLERNKYAVHKSRTWEYLVQNKGKAEQEKTAVQIVDGFKAVGRAKAKGKGIQKG
jgi:uncharacterized Fe-S cluster-containing protein